MSGAAYDSTHTYGVGDLVQFGNDVYRSLLVANLNNQPDQNSSAAWWAQVTRDGYAYVCPLPPDTLNPIEVWEKLATSEFNVPVFTFVQDTSGLSLRNPRSSGRVPFSLENANDGTDQFVLLTDLDTPILRYVADVTNPSALPSPFVQTFAWHLAAELAMGLRGDEKKAAACEQMARATLSEAFVAAMREQQADEEPISEFEAARQGVP